MRRAYTIWVLTFVLLPAATALECQRLGGGKQACEAIQASSLDVGEKDYLWRGLLNQDPFSPPHAFVQDWNNNIPLHIKPDGVEVYREGFIEDAWVKILTVLPSVIEDNVLYNPGQGSLLIGADYQVNIPYGRSSDGDCRTEYELLEHTANIITFLNNQHIGNGNRPNFQTNTDMHLGTRYEIRVVTKIKHYRTKWQKKRGHWVEKCKLERTENKIDTLTLRDGLDVEYYHPTITTNVTVLDKYDDTTKIQFQVHNATKSSITFADALFEQSRYTHEIISDLSPLNVLGIQAIPFISKNSDNLFFVGDQSYNVTVKNTEECEVSVQDHFATETRACDLAFEQEEIRIETDKTVYAPGEIITVHVTPNDKAFTLSYAKEKYEIRETVELTAVYPDNKIVVQNSLGKTYEAYVHVQNEKSNNFMFAFGIFVLVNAGIVA